MTHDFRIAFCVPVLLVAPSASVVRADLIVGIRTAAPEVYDRVTGYKGIEELDKAIDSFRRREYDKAHNLLNAATEKHPELPPAKLMLARLFLADSQISRGRSFLEQAAIEAPEAPGTYVTFAELALDEGRLTDAWVHFERAKALATADRWTEQRRNLGARIHSGLAAVAARRNDWTSARAHLSVWLDLDPKNGKAHQRLAQALFKLGDETPAYEEFQKANSIDPSVEPAAVSMAGLYIDKGDIGKAGEWMEKAVTDDPRDPRTHRALATWLLRQGNAERAKTHGDAAATLAPDSKETRVVCGLIARYRKDYTEAARIFEALHRDSPGDSSASNQLALVLVEQVDQSKQRRALQLAEINARLYPKWPEALSTLGWVYYRLGRLDEAERALRSAMSGENNSPDAIYYLARVVLDRNRSAEARGLLKAALDATGIFLFRNEANELLAKTQRSK